MAWTWESMANVFGIGVPIDIITNQDPGPVATSMGVAEPERLTILSVPPDRSERTAPFHTTNLFFFFPHSTNRLTDRFAPS